MAFSRLFGDLDDVKPYLTAGRTNRFAYDELFDVSNQNDDGSLIQPGSRRDHTGRGNGIFHVDSAFNPRRAGFSLLCAHELPPREMGGNTDFADTRSAWDDLSDDLKRHLLEKGYVGANSLWHSRRKACPESDYLRQFEPEDYPFGRHKIVQRHERSGRTNLYIANHLHHLETLADESAPKSEPEKRFKRVPEPESTKLIEDLLNHATQEKYVLSVEWQNVGDLIIWDNTAAMHRAGKGTFMGKFKRDMRRTTVHDGSSTAWGENEKVDKRMGMP